MLLFILVIYIGFSILKLSKLLMYLFHYDYVLKTSNNVKLLFTDTDSLVWFMKLEILKIKNYLILVDMIKKVFIIVIVIKRS